MSDVVASFYMTYKKFFAIYKKVFRGFMHGFFLLVAALIFFWIVMGIADLTFGLHWGYSWDDVLLVGPGMALATGGVYLFVRGIMEILDRIDRYLNLS